jgi:hypothetical protein
MNIISHIIPSPWTKKIGAILKEHAGATEEQAGRIDHLENHEGDSETRFCGGLGFGGKFRHNYARWRVDCYSEDNTPARQKMILETNKALKTLREEFLRAHPSFCLTLSGEDFEKALGALHEGVKAILAPYGNRFSPWHLRQLENDLERERTQANHSKHMRFFGLEGMGGTFIRRLEDGTVEIYSRTMYLWIRLLLIQNGATFSWVDEASWNP